MRLAAEVDRGIAFAYFYCQHDEPEKRDPKMLFGSLLHQLISQLPLHSPCIHAISLDTISDISKSIAAVAKEFRHTYLIVDALDECDIKAFPSIMSCFTLLSGDTSLLITSRDDPLINKAFRAESTVSINPQDIEHDIKEFVKGKIYPSPGTESSICVKDQTLRDEIFKALVEGAHGMYAVIIGN